MRKIPFLDLITPHQELMPELADVFRRALSTASFIGGAEVEGFEAEFARFCEVDHCIGVGSGTDALRFALIAAGVKPDDTVITVPNTFIATTEAISQAGGTPAYVDVDARTYTMSPEKLRSYLEEECERDGQSGRLVHRITRKPVTAVVPVHLYGQVAEMDPILELAETYGLVVIEDACQAHGAEYFSKREQRWRKAGSMGLAAAFSFYPGKNLGACGEAGAVCTGDGNVASICRMLRDHGQSRKYHHDFEGYNGRLDAVQAGILRIKLARLHDWNEQRRTCGRIFDESLRGAPVALLTCPFVPEWSRPVYHLYVVRVPNRAKFQQDLDSAGIQTGIHYPVPLHLSKPYSHMGWRTGDFPVVERLSSEVVSLPMYPHLSTEQQQRVVDATLESIAGRTVQVAE
jgi:dTDP-4-amino-4,6-dideoxygalactose transaminase